MAVRLAAAPPDAAAPSRDRSLQAVRRLDWRFLLPEPELGRVVYLGAGEDRLLAALREFSASLAVVPDTNDAAGHGLPDESFDVAVLQAPSPRALARAAALVRPGGYLYCEPARPAAWDGSLLGRRRGADAERLRGLPHARLLLREGGFLDLEAHWHYPDFVRCGWIVPVDRAAAAGFLLARAGSRRLTALAVTMGGWIWRADLVARLVPCASFVARKDGAQ